MSDEIKIHPDARATVLAAIMAAGPTDDAVKWRARVNSALGPIAAMLTDGAPQMNRASQIMDPETKVFFGTYDGYSTEPNTKRLIVHLINKDGEPERDMRTDWTTSPEGARMKAVLDKIDRGSRVQVWKALETSKTDPNKKIRILAHIEDWGQQDARRIPPPSGQTQQVTQPAASSPAPRDTAPGVPGESKTMRDEIADGGTIGAATEGLSNKVVVAFMRHMRGNHIDNPMVLVPGDGDYEFALAALNRLKEGMEP